MVKRKRDEDETQNVADRKVENALQLTRKSVKKVKVFEVQRLVKKLRISSKSPEKVEDTERLNSELAATKTADESRLARTALLTKIRKDYALSSHIGVQDILRRFSEESFDAAPAKSTMELRVESRILSSKALATDIIDRITTLKKALNLGDSRGKGPKADEPLSGRKAGIAVDDASGEASNDDDPQLDGMVANSSESESSSSNSEASLMDTLPSRKVVRPSAGISDLGSISVDDEIDDEEEEEEDNTTTFLPSLSAGFTTGDPDASDWSGAEDVDEKPAERKNRRGQRARKAIWEKKYGKNANHIKKQRLESQDQPGTFTSHPRQASSRGRPDRDRVRGSWRQPLPQRGEKPPHQGLSEHPHLKPLKEAEAKPLHPSWEAKRKLKESESRAAAIVPSQGTRITF